MCAYDISPLFYKEWGGDNAEDRVVSVSDGLPSGGDKNPLEGAYEKEHKRTLDERLCLEKVRLAELIDDFIECLPM